MRKGYVNSSTRNARRRRQAHGVVSVPFNDSDGVTLRRLIPAEDASKVRDPKSKVTAGDTQTRRDRGEREQICRSVEISKEGDECFEKPTAEVDRRRNISPRVRESIMVFRFMSSLRHRY